MQKQEAHDFNRGSITRVDLINIATIVNLYNVNAVLVSINTVNETNIPDPIAIATSIGSPKLPDGCRIFVKKRRFGDVRKGGSDAVLCS